jgi:hypothetical protein
MGDSFNYYFRKTHLMTQNTHNRHTSVGWYPVKVQAAVTSKLSQALIDGFKQLQNNTKL